MSLQLGCYDPGTKSSQIDLYVEAATKLSGVADGRLICDAGVRKLVEFRDEHLSVSDLQQFLIKSGFLPEGKIDGIFGYRTHSATRLFQEYVRAYDKESCLPDGIVGPQTRSHIHRWLDTIISADWVPILTKWQNGQLSDETSYNHWIEFLLTLKKHYLEHPTPVVELVKNFDGETDTLAPADWNFNKKNIHIIGIRRKDQDEARKFDDIFVLLIRGMVFKFQGTTDPGSSKNPDGAPFLVIGQHAYRFGLHQKSYHALRPFSFDKNGVLVVRSKGDFKLSESDINKGVTANGTINIHWGGKGVGRRVARWSEGCQVLAGSGYEDYKGNLISCASYVAINNGEVKSTKGRKTRGAYNVLGDLITAFGSGLVSDGKISFTLIDENDCIHSDSIALEVSDSLRDARQFVAEIV